MNAEQNGGYPKLQWSKFNNGDKGEQFVVRADDFAEFTKLIEQAKTLMATPPEQPSTTWLKEPIRERVMEPEQSLICNTCGQPATARSGVSKKTGKSWKAIFCSTNDKSHVEWL